MEKEKEKNNKRKRNQGSNLNKATTNPARGSSTISTPGPSTSSMPGPSTSPAPGPSTSSTPGPSTSTRRRSKHPEVISLSDSQTTEASDNDSSPWTDSKNIVQTKQKCPYCTAMYEKRQHLIKHITMTCLANPDSKANKEAGKFRCVDCGRNYTHAKSLRYHQRHECKQTVTCPDCGKSMRGTYITERHKQNHCVKKRRTKKIKQEDSPDELFIDDSSIEF